MSDLLVNALRWLVVKSGVRNLLALGLMLLAQISVAYGLDISIRRLPDNYLVSAVMVGLLTGWLLGAKHWKSIWAALFGLAAAAIWNLIAAGKLFLLILQALAAVIGLLFKGLPWKVDWTPAADLFLRLIASTQAALVELNNWIYHLLQGNFSFSPIAAPFFWGLCCFGSAAWGSWCLRRKRAPLVAILPGGLLLSAVLNYTRSPILSIASLLGSMLMLMALEHYAARETLWESNHLDFSEELRRDVIVAVVALSLSISTLAGAVPSLPVKPVAEIARRVLPASPNRPLAESLGLGARPAASGEPLALGSGGLPRQHLIGSGSELSKKLIFTVSTNDPPASSSEGYENLDVPRYYWRSLVYDIYTGQGWQTSATVETDYPPGDLIIEGFETPGHYLVQNIEGVVELNELLYTAGTPVAVDHPLRGLWRTPPQAGQPGDSFAFTLSSNQYQAVSWLAAAGSQELRQAGQEYPPEIAGRYLQLPSSLPTRVRQLAERLTQEYTANYDKAQAIESYLRRYAYNLDLPDPPRDLDLSDYFLFELQQGYCDYYATAMVVLSRAAGIPARLVTGYATGIFDPQKSYYRVVEADAHSWPELFFPGYGWIEFEPTAGLSAIQRAELAASPGMPREIPPPPDLPADFSPASERLWAIMIANPALLLGILFAASLVVLFVIIFFQAKASSHPQAIESMLVKLKQAAQHLDIETSSGQTAHELAAALQRRLNPAVMNGLWKRIIHPCQTELDQWAQAYSRSVYGPPPLPLFAVKRALSAWQRLRWRLWLARYWRPKR
jgi:transglutaminase-like putative cysteine protease